MSILHILPNVTSLAYSDIWKQLTLERYTNAQIYEHSLRYKNAQTLRYMNTVYVRKIHKRSDIWTQFTLERYINAHIYEHSLR